jgi:hypothetical protein
MMYGAKLLRYRAWWTINTDSGLVRFDYYSQLDSSVHFSLLYKYPAKRGDSYADGRIRVAAIDTLITVRAGSYRCVQYDFYDHGMLTNEHFVSPGLGVIKTTDYFPSLPQTVWGSEELLHYELK